MNKFARFTQAYDLCQFVSHIQRLSDLLRPPIMYAFSRLSTRYNNEIADPTEMDCHYALADLFHETDPELDANHYARYPTVWFSVGHIEGDCAPFYTLEVDRYGMARFQYWPRTSENPEFEYRARVTELVARTLWDNLNRRKINTLIAWFLAQAPQT